MTIKLILLDLDGTTLRRDGTISDRTARALHRAQASGVTVGFCTGRLHSNAALLARRIGLTGPIISGNGGLIRDLDGHTLLNQPLPAAVVPAAIAAGLQTGVDMHISHGDRLWVNSTWRNWRDRFALRHLRTLTSPAVIRDRIAQWRSIPLCDASRWQPADGLPEKVFLCDQSRERLEETLALILQRVSGPLEITSSGPDNIEINAAGVSKGSAAAWLASHYGLRLDQVMVAGDSLNDLSMFELDCFRVAMGNARTELKERAQFVTASHMEDGVALAVERFVLKEAV
jgi:Cof subfamily protein (haloacid dehalogenase superfamily)